MPDVRRHRVFKNEPLELANRSRRLAKLNSRAAAEKLRHDVRVDELEFLGRPLCRTSPATAEEAE